MVILKEQKKKCMCGSFPHFSCSGGTGLLSGGVFEGFCIVNTSLLYHTERTTKYCFGFTVLRALKRGRGADMDKRKASFSRKRHRV